MSQKTTLAIVNFSGMDITNIQVSNVSGFEKTSNGPAHLFNGHKSPEDHNELPRQLRYLW